MAKIEKFIAANSKVAITRASQKAQWYTTKKEIVFDPATAVTCNCPMGSTANGQPVKVSRITVDGIDVFFAPLSARSRLVLEDGDIDAAAFQQVYSCFQYDIPKGPNGPVYPNPSGWLRHIAVRDQLSGWLIKKGAVSTARQIEMMDAGCTVTIRDYAEYEAAQIVRDIIASMYKEAQVLAASVAEREQSADEYLAEAQEKGIDEKTARKNYESRMKSIARETEERVKAMAEAAKNFGFQGANSFVDLRRVQKIAATTQTKMAEKARTYKQAAAALAATGDVNAVAAANVMQDVNAPEMPVEMIADMLIEQGKDKEAAELAQAHGTGVYGAVLEAPVAPESDQASAETTDDVFDLV